MRDYIKSAKKAHLLQLVLSALCLFSIFDYLDYARFQETYRMIETKKQDLRILTDVRWDLSSYLRSLQSHGELKSAEAVNTDISYAISSKDDGKHLTEMVGALVDSLAISWNDMANRDLSWVNSWSPSRGIETLDWGELQTLIRVRVASEFDRSEKSWKEPASLSPIVASLCWLALGIECGDSQGSLPALFLKYADGKSLDRSIEYTDREIEFLNSRVPYKSPSQYRIPGIGVDISTILLPSLYLILSVLIGVYVKEVLRVVVGFKETLKPVDLNWIVLAKPGLICFPYIYLFGHLIVGAIVTTVYFLSPAPVPGLSSEATWWLNILVVSVYWISMSLICFFQYDSVYNIRSRVIDNDGKPGRFREKPDGGMEPI